MKYRLQGSQNFLEWLIEITSDIKLYSKFFLKF